MSRATAEQYIEIGCLGVQWLNLGKNQTKAAAIFKSEDTINKLFCIIDLKWNTEYAAENISVGYFQLWRRMMNVVYFCPSE